MKKFIFSVAGILVVGAANAVLRVDQNSSLGTNCYSEDAYNWRLVECYFSESVEEQSSLPWCPSTLNQIMTGDDSNWLCKISSNGNVFRICVSQALEPDSENIQTACEEVFNSGSEYKSIGGNKVSRDSISWDINSVYGWIADFSIYKTTEYGCAANYYTTATFPSASMTCNPCPSSGKSSVGNTVITGCYIPANTPLTDETGDYTFISNCHYSK